MKILLFSDIHIHHYRPYSYDLDGMNSRLRWSLRALEYILEYAYKNDLSIWFLGDLFEDRKTLRMEAAAETARVLNMYPRAGNGPFMHVVPGNHDYYSRTGTVWELFKEHAVVYEEPTVIDLEGKRVAIHPYPMDGYDSFKQFLATHEADYLFTHADMDVEKAGLDEHEIKVGATSIELYKAYRHVYSGHYHWRQTVNNFTYLGNPIQKDFGDYGQDKGFFVLDLHDGNGSSEFKALPEKFPRFERFDVASPEDWGRVVEHRVRRPQDYLRVDYDPVAGISKDFDITSNPAPVLTKRRTNVAVPGSRLAQVQGLDKDPVKAYMDFKKKNGVLIPAGADTFANEILSEVKK